MHNVLKFQVQCTCLYREELGEKFDVKVEQEEERRKKERMQ